MQGNSEVEVYVMCEYMDAGSMLASGGKGSQAMPLLLRAVTLAPANTDALCNYGAVLAEVSVHI